MNKIVEVILVACLIFVLLANSSTLSAFADSVTGRAILIGLIVLAALHNTISGLIAVLIFISIRSNIREGHSNHQAKHSESDEDETEKPVQPKEEESNMPVGDKTPSSVEMDFRTKHCKNGELVDKDGNKVASEDIGVKYPNLNFDSDKCNNPCDENCGFSLSTTADQIGTEESLRAQDSSKIPVNPNQSAGNAQPTQMMKTKEGFLSL